MRKVLVLSMVLALAACKKKAEPQATGKPGKPAATAKAKGTKAPPVPRAAAPVDLIGHGIVGSIDAVISALEPYLAAMGASMTTVAGVKATIGKWFGLASWDGVDGSKPMRVWVLNPKKHRHPVVVGMPTFAGKQIQTRAGWAARKVGSYTLIAKRANVLAASAARAQRDLSRKVKVSPSRVVFDLQVAKLIAAYEPEIQRMLGRMTRLVGGGGRAQGGARKLLGWLVRALVDVGKQLEAARAELDPARDLARFTLRLTPRPGTGLAKFLASTRKPSAEVLSRIPADVAGALAISFEPAALERLAGQIADHMEKAGGPASVAKLIRTVVAPLVKVLRGDIVFAKETTGGGPTLLLFGARDGKKALSGIRDVFQRMGAMSSMAMGSMRIESKVSFKAKAGRYKGVPYDRMRVSYDFSKMPRFQARLFERLMGKAHDTFLATKGGYVVVVGTRGSDAQPMRSALDHLSAKAGPGLDQRAEFKALRKRLPANAFGIVYFSLVDYLKTAFGALAKGGMVPASLAAITSAGFLGAGLSAPKGALQVDLVATRSHIQAIRKLFKALRPMRPGPGMRPPGFPPGAGKKRQKKGT